MLCAGERGLGILGEQSARVTALLWVAVQRWLVQGDDIHPLGLHSLFEMPSGCCVGDAKWYSLGEGVLIMGLQGGWMHGEKAISFECAVGASVKRWRRRVLSAPWTRNAKLWFVRARTNRLF
jgi:hypothetical protein